MTGIVIHIGFSKTGTTTLQRAVFEKHSQVYYLGKIQKSEHERQCATADTFDFLAPLLWKTDQPVDVETQREFFSKTLTPRAVSARIILGSWEGLGQQDISAFRTSVNRLKAACGQCKVVMTLRNPITRLPSLYLQHLRGNQKQLAETYSTFDEWLESEETRLGSLNKVFEYREYVETAIDVLGADNVGVFLYEVFDTDPEKYLQGVADFLGIDGKEVVDLADGERHHTRLFDSQVKQMETRNSTFIGRLRWRFSSVEKKKKAIGFADQDGVIQTTVAADKPAAVDLSPETIQRVSDAVSADNRWLVDNLHLELAEYGYPL